jgi:serine protease Do
VVNISVTGSTKTAHGPQGRDDPFADDPFYEFFRRFQGQQRGQRASLPMAWAPASSSARTASS